MKKRKPLIAIIESRKNCDLLCGSDKVTLGCFFEFKLKSSEIVIPNHRKSSRYKKDLLEKSGVNNPFVSLNVSGKLHFDKRNNMRITLAESILKVDFAGHS